MAESFTRVTLFVPGAAASEAAWNERLQRSGVRIEAGVLCGDGIAAPPAVEWVENDGSFGRAFSFGTVGSDVIETLEAAPGALVVHWSIDLRDGRQTIVQMVEHLRDAGAIAVRLEQSKLGWGIARWIEVFSSDDAWAWHRAAITFLAESDALQSCGMHAFSLPDVMIGLDGDQAELTELASTLDVYQLAEDPVIRSGQTFTPDRETPRRVVERWPDLRYPAGHACHNPYGVWRLGPPGGTAREVGELALVFIPALQVVLSALQQKARKPFTKKQVLATRDQGACIAMDPRDAQRLERERGYSDLDPELVWEQWTLVQS